MVKAAASSAQTSCAGVEPRPPQAMGTIPSSRRRGTTGAPATARSTRRGIEQESPSSQPGLIGGAKRTMAGRIPERVTKPRPTSAIGLCSQHNRSGRLWNGSRRSPRRCARRRWLACLISGADRARSDLAISTKCDRIQQQWRSRFQPEQCYPRRHRELCERGSGAGNTSATARMT